MNTLGSFWKMILLVAVLSFLAFLIMSMRLKIAFYGMLAMIGIFIVGWGVSWIVLSLILWVLR